MARRHARPAVGLDRGVRVVVALSGAVLFVDTLFTTALAPLLPHLKAQLSLSDAGAGALAGSYALGTLVAGPALATIGRRVRVRWLVGGGLAVLALGAVAFGLAPTFGVAVGSLAIQGMGGAACWAGSLAWIAGLAPPERRGELIGYAVSASSAGGLSGPLLGAAAAAYGRAQVFAAAGATAAALSLLALRVRYEPRREPPVQFRRLRLSLALAAALLLTALLSGLTGALSVLGSLRLAALGGSAGLIGLAFACGALIELVVGPVAGRVSDRRGRLLPMWLGLPVCAVLFASFPLPASVRVLAVVVAVTGPVIGCMWTPSSALTGDAAERAAVPLALAYVLNNLAWAMGRSVGSTATGVLQTVGGAALAAGAASAFCLLGLAGLILTARRVHLTASRSA